MKKIRVASFQLFSNLFWTLMDEIINFVLNSPEDTNSKIVVFIAGMQAQKSLISCDQKVNRAQCITNNDCLTDLKTGPPVK